MPRRGRKKKFKFKINISTETIRTVLGLIVMLAAFIALVSFFAPDYVLNSKFQNVLRGTFGLPSILLPFLLLLIGTLFFQNLKVKFKEPRVVAGLTGLLISLSGIFHVFLSPENALEVAEAGKGGGMLGYKLTSMLSGAVSVYGAVAILLIALFISGFILFNLSMDQVLAYIGKNTEGYSLGERFRSIFNRQESDLGDVEISSTFADTMHTNEYTSDQYKDMSVTSMEPHFEILPNIDSPQNKGSTERDSLVSPLIENTSFDFSKVPSDKIWEHPPITLLSEPPTELIDTSEADIKKKVIKEKLKQFGIDVEVVDVKIGTSFTQYVLQTKSITRVSKIASLHEDLALALASPTGSVRIEAPIPGTSYVGIEVPNVNRSMVYFKSLLTSDIFKAQKSKLSIVLGKDVGGRSFTYDISKMPHILIAGATGSGKSVFIHNILFSILYKASPQEVKFIIIDPKRIELSLYQDIPHLLTPVVTDTEKAPSVFKWAVEEMERRYKLFEQAKVRNIDSYNDKSGIQVMPYIVIIVDELAEIMIKDPQSVEKSIIRLAQLARATGIHLVMAVQRPSTNIITGLIKANIPCRVAFNVTSQVDSRVIIDQPGAEKLLGKGDMLFVPPDVQKPVRLQGAYISDREISNLVGFLKGQGIAPDYLDAVLAMPSDTGGNSGSSSDWGDGVDSVFDKAVEIVTTTGKASASLLQRRLSIGYARAARIIDEMEERGIIGPSMGGSKPREVLIDSFTPPSAYNDMNSSMQHDADIKIKDIDSIQEDDL